jgi:hypothetical protein
MNRHLGVECNMAYHAGTHTIFSTTQTSFQQITRERDNVTTYLCGPKITEPIDNFELFTHFLAGGMHDSENGAYIQTGDGTFETETAVKGTLFGMEVGGGVDWVPGTARRTARADGHVPCEKKKGRPFRLRPCIDLHVKAASALLHAAKTEIYAHCNLEVVYTGDSDNCFSRGCTVNRAAALDSAGAVNVITLEESNTPVMMERIRASAGAGTLEQALEVLVRRSRAAS